MHSCEDVLCLFAELKDSALKICDRNPAELANHYYVFKVKLVQLIDALPPDLVGDAYFDEKKESLRWHVASIADLEDGNDHDIDQHRVWVRGDLGRLRECVVEHFAP